MAAVTTTIQFIGLIVTRLIVPDPTQPPTGALLTIGNFGSGAPNHERLLAYEKDKREAGSDWNANGQG